MPDIEKNYYSGVHYHKDTNYKGHHICNECANTKWNPLLRCFCGNTVHEVDMIDCGTSYVYQINPNQNSLLYKSLINLAYASFNQPLDSEQAHYLFINRGCRNCITESGFITDAGLQAIDKCLSLENVSDGNLDLSNVWFSDFIMNSDVSIAINEDYYIDPNTNLPMASVLGYIQKRNPGFCARITKESQIF